MTDPSGNKKKGQSDIHFQFNTKTGEYHGTTKKQTSSSGQSPSTAPAAAKQSPLLRFLREKWWIILGALLVIALFRNLSQGSGSSSSAPAPTIRPDPVIMPSSDPKMELDGLVQDRPGFIPKDALVVYGTEGWGELDWHISNALEERKPEFWIMNNKSFGMANIRDQFYGCFWVKNLGMTDFTVKNADGSVDTFTKVTVYYYDYTEDQIAYMKGEMEIAAGRLFTALPEGADDWMQAKVLHDQLISTVTYDHTLSGPHIHDAYGALVLHSAVCDGYASAYCYLLRLAGISSENSYSDDHAWTHLWLDSPESYVDVTWDDPDRTDQYGRPYVLYNYFLVTFDEMRQVDHHAFVTNEVDFYDIGYGDTYVPNNYYTHEGYMLYSCDEREIIRAFKNQAGSNCVTVRFYYENDYARTGNWDTAVVDRILSAIGYQGQYMLLRNDTFRTVTFCLYP